jgi:hypothetical protein
MRDIGSLRTLGGQLEPPPIRELEEVARRRGRLVAVGGALAGVVAAAAVALVVMLVPRNQNAVPEPVETPTPTPTPSASATVPTEPPSATAAPTHASDTSMTPREVVAKPNAQLVMAGVSADDPDFRVSVWTAVCPWCPNDDEPRGRPRFSAMATTTDGFATATYRRLPFEDTGLYNVESPGPGMLLFLDVGNEGPGWLLRADGTLTRLTQVVEDRPAASPRLWHLCHDINVDGQGEWVTWCALDPATNTQYVWHDPWRNPLYDPPALDPGSGEQPWGFIDPPDDHLVAYWWDGGTRHTRDFGLAPSKGLVNEMPRGEMAVWSLDKESHILTIYSSSDKGSSWQTHLLQAPSYSWDLTVSRTPEGALLVRDDYPSVDDATAAGAIGIWRAESLDAGAFEAVYGPTSRTDGVRQLAPPFAVVEGRIWTGGLYSDDDGRTWSSILDWR